MVHIAIAGTGRVGQALAYTLMFEHYVDQLTLVDIAPKVAEMTKEELYHGAASWGLGVTIEAYEHSKFIENADLIIIPAGFPRKPGMDRRDLAGQNAGAIKDIVTSTVDNNPKAWYFVITNPVDAMATLAWYLTEKKRKVVGTGTKLETVRFKTILARKLGVPLRLVEGFVGGEHGRDATPLWSTVRIDGMPLDDYLNETKKTINKEEVTQYVKGISMEVIKALGGTRWGPAGGFLEIIRGILLNTGRMTAYAIPRKFETTQDAVHVTVPGRISRTLGPDIWNDLTAIEQEQIKKAAQAIENTFNQVKE